MAQHFVHGLALVGVCSLLGLSACGSEAPEAAPVAESASGQAATAGALPGRPVAEETAGSLELSLELGDKQQLDSMNYAVVG